MSSLRQNNTLGLIARSLFFKTTTTIFAREIFLRRVFGLGMKIQGIFIQGRASSSCVLLSNANKPNYGRTKNSKNEINQGNFKPAQQSTCVTNRQNPHGFLVGLQSDFFRIDREF